MIKKMRYCCVAVCNTLDESSSSLSIVRIGGAQIVEVVIEVSSAGESREEELLIELMSLLLLLN